MDSCIVKPDQAGTEDVRERTLVAELRGNYPRAARPAHSGPSDHYSCQRCCAGTSAFYPIAERFPCMCIASMLSRAKPGKEDVFAARSVCTAYLWGVASLPWPISGGSQSAEPISVEDEQLLQPIVATTTFRPALLGSVRHPTDAIVVPFRACLEEAHDGMAGITQVYMPIVRGVGDVEVAD